MPRPGPRRTFVGIRLAPAGLDAVQAIADAEHPIPGKPHGNLSEAIRTLLAEAIAARQRRANR